MKTLKSMVMVLSLVFGASVSAQEGDDTKIMKDATNAKEKLMGMDNGIDNFFENSAGYVIFPNVGKGGLILGAASGNGVVYENGTPIGMANLKKLDVGLQAGGQAITEIIFFETAEDLADFKKNEFEFSAGVSAVALKSGVSLDAKYKDGVAVFTLPKAGLMAEATVGGQRFEYTPFTESK